MDVWIESRPRREPGLQTLDHSFLATVPRACYKRLDPAQKELRVLRVEAEDVTYGPALRLSLHHERLETRSRLSYQALSYCWGSARDSEDITIEQVDGRNISAVIQISKDLYTALYSLRLPSKPRFLWVDQVCINQADLGERASQVMLMDQIFASATEVIMWLGDADERTKSNMAIIRQIADRHDKTGGSTSMCPQRDCSQGNRLRQCRELHDPGSADSIFIRPEHDTIFGRPWFARVWVIQEVWNMPAGISDLERASRVHVQCGTETISWSAILQAQYCLRTNDHAIRHNSISKIWYKLFHVQRQQHLYHSLPAPRLDILTVLVSALDIQATDPRDKIFALLGFGQETQDLQEVPMSIRPDYTKPISQVFSDFTRWWITHHRSLRILSTVQTQYGRTWLDVAKASGDASAALKMVPKDDEERRPSRPPVVEFLARGFPAMGPEHTRLGPELHLQRQR